MDNVKQLTKHTYFDGKSKKSINPWADSDEGWTLLSDTSNNKEDLFFRRVPWLYRGVHDRANNVGKMPFSIMQGETEKDSSHNYQNVIDCMPNPIDLFKKIEMSMIMTGAAYVVLEKNKAGYVKNLKYVVASSITELRSKETGEITGFERDINGRKKTIPVENMLAFYDTDYQVEIGKPLSSPAKAALTSAGVLYNTDVFVSNFFERGAIKATIFTTLGMTEEQATKFKVWLSNLVTGLKNSWTSNIFNAEKINPVVIGEGLESLENETLTKERRQNIATALGIPESRLWSAAANYATSENDTKTYYESTIIPECDIIAEVLNSQLFTESNKLGGYKIDFNYENLDILKKSILEMSQAAQTLVNLGIPLLMALDKAGMELSKEERAELEALQNKEKQDDKNQDDQNNDPMTDNIPPQFQDNQQDQQNNQDDSMRSVDLEKWKTKAIKRLKEKGSAVCEFVSDNIPEKEAERIFDGLKYCETNEQIRSLFDSVGSDDKLDANLISKQLAQIISGLANG